MADVNSSNTNTFRPFSWLDSDAQRYPLAEFVANSHDMANGLSMLLEMLEDAFLREESGDTQYFDQLQQGKLLRFAIASANSLQSEARQAMEWLNRQGGQIAKQPAAG